MKLLLCVTCNEVFNLSHTYKECSGGHGGGRYINDLDANIWGPSDKIFCLGFANSTLVDALRAQINKGDSTEMMSYGGKLTPKGRRFEAFIIPDAADSVVRMKDKDSV